MAVVFDAEMERAKEFDAEFLGSFQRVTIPGKDGGHYTPVFEQVDDEHVRVSFVPSDETLPEVEETILELPQGPKGDAYILTDADKTEIAEEAAELIEVGELGETDPTVPSWAKQPTKPTYTAAEVGALPNTTKIPSKPEDIGALPSTTKIPSKPEDIGAQPVGNYLTAETDPTVPSWAKQPTKPSYTASEVGALPSTTKIPSTPAEVGADPAGTAGNSVSAHNTNTEAHNDMRLQLQALTDRLNAFFDSDDTTLDELSEIVTYIKSNKTLIDSITTSKVNVSDIIDNLITNVANKPLSAAQGVVLKGLIDALNTAKLDANALADWAKQPNKPTYTAAEVGALPSTTQIPSKPEDIGAASATAVQQLSEEIVDLAVTPQMYGAVGDGEHDDTDAFENALAENNYVFVPNGSYLVKRPIDLTNEKSLVGSENQGATLIYDGADTDSVVLIGRLSVFRNINITVKKAFKGVVFDTDNMKIDSDISGLNSRVEHSNVVFAERSPEATLIRIIMDSGTDANNMPSLNGVCFQTYNDISVDAKSLYYGCGIEMTLVQGRPFTEETKAGFPWITHIDFDDIFLGSPYTAIKAGVNNTSGSEYFERIHTGHILFNNVYTQYYTSATGAERTRYFLDVEHFAAYLTKCMAWDYHHLGLAGEKCNIIGEDVNLSLNDCEMVFGVDFLESCDFTAETDSGFTVENNPSYFTDKYFKGTFLRNGYDTVDAKIDTKLADEYIGNIAEKKVNDILYSGYSNILEDPRTIVKVGYGWSSSGQAWVERTDAPITTLVIPVVKGGNIIRWTPKTTVLSDAYSSVYFFNEDLTISYGTSYGMGQPVKNYLVTDGDDTYLMYNNPSGFPYASVVFQGHIDLSPESMFMTINREITNNVVSYTEYLKDSVINPAIDKKFASVKIPTKTSQLTNDSNFLTAVPSEYVTETELAAKKYLTAHQDISGKADKSNAETWTFTLADGTTVTKKVVLA